ncbi:MAG: TIGR04283 family arsenosugar biosynthesis glycosyltransferase [Ferruginibacter sp.]
MQYRISIIIPTYNEAGSISQLVAYLFKHAGGIVHEIIISDGGSTDQTLMLAEEAGAKAVVSTQKGRAAQMNYGVQISAAEIVYFVHADCFPPVSFATDIIEAVKIGFDFGRYRTRFDSSKFMLKINAWFTRFNWFICYGGDQTLFVTRKLFERSGGFKNQLLIMEEYEFCERLMKNSRYKIFADAALISARKYEGRSWLQVQLANRKAVQLFKKGASQQEIIEQYKLMLNK